MKLHDAIDPHGNDVQYGTYCRQPEVGVDQGCAVHGLNTPKLGNQVVNGTDTDQGNPAQGTGVNVADGPVSVVGKRVNGLDGHHRTFKRGHAVERQ